MEAGSERGVAFFFFKSKAGWMEDEEEVKKTRSKQTETTKLEEMKTEKIKEPGDTIKKKWGHVEVRRQRKVHGSFPEARGLTCF